MGEADPGSSASGLGAVRAIFLEFLFRLCFMLVAVHFVYIVGVRYSTIIPVTFSIVVTVV